MLDPTVKPAGAKHIGFIGNKLMVEPSEHAFDVLVHKRSMRLDSFGCGVGVGSPRLGNEVMDRTFDPKDSASKLHDLMRVLVHHKVDCALKV